MPPRTAALLTALVVIAAGCLGVPAGDPTESATASPASPSPTESSSPPEQPPPTTTAGIPDNCSATRPAGVDPVRDSVSPVDYPGPPTELTEETAGQWAAAFEEAYLRNDHLSRKTISFGVSASVDSVTSVGDSYLVHVRARWYSKSGDVTTGTATPTVVHADSPIYLSAYLVTENGAWRAAETGANAPYPEPRSGDVVACF